MQGLACGPGKCRGRQSQEEERFLQAEGDPGDETAESDVCF